METFLDPTSQCSPTLSESHLIPNKFVPAIQKYLKKKEERYNFAVHNENALKKKKVAMKEIKIVTCTSK